MNDYTKLIKALRYCATHDCTGDGEYEAGCTAPYDQSAPKDCGTCNSILMWNAADAIEELSREIDIDNAAMTAMDAAVPHWIPVTERLPEEYHQVLVYGLNGMQIDYYAGGKSIGGRPLFMISEAKVTHWMPLPEPPKEET